MSERETGGEKGDIELHPTERKQKIKKQQENKRQPNNTKLSAPAQRQRTNKAPEGAISKRDTLQISPNDVKPERGGVSGSRK